LEAMRMIKIWRNELNSLWWGRGSQQNRTHWLPFIWVLNNVSSLHRIRAIPFRTHWKLSLRFAEISGYSGNTLTLQNETDRVHLECLSSLKPPSPCHYG
jgi:hypothetical protein